MLFPLKNLKILISLSSVPQNLGKEMDSAEEPEGKIREIKGHQETEYGKSLREWIGSDIR